MFTAIISLSNEMFSYDFWIFSMNFISLSNSLGFYVFLIIQLCIFTLKAVPMFIFVSSAFYEGGLKHSSSLNS